MHTFNKKGVKGMGNNKLDQRFYPEVYQAVAGNNYTVYAYLNDGSVRKFDIDPMTIFECPIVPDIPEI